MDERDGGVYVQSEVVSLTRDIPAGLGWLIGPFVNSIPKETLTFTLEATRKAVEGSRKNQLRIGKRLFFNRTEQDTGASQKRVEPTDMFFFTAGNSNDAVRPLRDQVKGIVNAVGISETIALGDHVAFSARTHVIEDFPQPGLIKRQFHKSCDR